MKTGLDFEFLAILNALVIVLWPASGTYSGTRSNVLNIIMIILTAIAVILDIVFLAIRLVH